MTEKGELLFSFDQEGFRETTLRRKNVLRLGAALLLLGISILVLGMGNDGSLLLVFPLVVTILLLVAISPRRTVPKTQMVRVFAEGIEICLGPILLRPRSYARFFPFYMIRSITEKDYGDLGLRCGIHRATIFSSEHNEAIMEAYEAFWRELS